MSTSIFKKLSVALLLSCVCTALWAKQPSLSPFLQKQFVKARGLMETESWADAQTLLADLERKTENRFAKALAAQSLGQIAIYQDDMARALKRFKQAFDLQVLDEASATRLMHSIGQLYCALEQWRACQDTLVAWLAREGVSPKAGDYIMIAQAYAAPEQWAKVPRYVNKALALKAKAPINWYQLEVAAWAQKSLWPQAIGAQKRLLQHYATRPVEWRRLVSMLVQNDDYKGALSAMRLPFEKGWLESESDYRQMAQLLYHRGVPHKAAEVLAAGIEKGEVSDSLDNLKLLGNLWQQAKARDKAIAVFEELAERTNQRRWLVQLAQLHYQAENWRAAGDYLKQALAKQQEPKLQLMFAVTLINQHDYQLAKRSLTVLLADESIKSRAQNWLNYIDRVTG